MLRELKNWSKGIVNPTTFYLKFHKGLPEIRLLKFTLRDSNWRM